MNQSSGSSPAGRGALGRGLAALLPGAGEAVRDVDVDLISPNPEQPRRRFDSESLAELASSIGRYGVLQPLIVTREVSGSDSVSYRLIAGERRLQAARLAGLTRVPVVVREAADVQRLELALVENLQRADLGPLEEAEAFKRLVEDFGLTQEEVGRRVGRGRVAVANALRLLNLGPAIKSALSAGELSAGHARALLGVADEPDRVRIAALVQKNGLSVRQVEALVRTLQKSAPAQRSGSRGTSDDSDRGALEEQLRDALATQVEIQSARRGGRIVIRYYDQDDLQEILAVLLRGRQVRGGGDA